MIRRTDFAGALTMTVASLLVACGGSSPPNDAATDVSTIDGMDSTPTCTGTQVACGGRCVDTQADPDHCGTCETACSRLEVCVAGHCQVGCVSGQVNCGGRCVTLETDRLNCGACGTTCPAGQVCAMGRCGVECGATLATCTGADDGGTDGGNTSRYCSDTRTDRLNCGACGNVCPPGQICAGSRCQISCVPGLTVCGDSCRDLSNDRLDCGACGTVCPSGQVCSAGSCAVSCGAGLTDCGGSCRDTQTDRANCGVCGTTCGPGTICSAGSCQVTCGAGLTNCSGTCRDLSNDRLNCGACSTTCPSGQVCSTGSCAVSCGAGLTNCGGTCRDTQTDRANCGACGMTCPSGQVCSAGSCLVTCGGGLTNCDGVCRDLQNDRLNCGACGMTCAAGMLCSAGSCQVTCGAGLANCAGTCRDLLVDNANCGMCGHPCAAGTVCSGGACAVTCGGGLTNCSGICRDTQTDRNNCGACGTACLAGQVCTGGSCAVTCGGGLTNCSGTCRDLLTDRANCGMCGMGCPAGTVCSAGTCQVTCGTGLTNCSGTCRDLTTDNANCGTCGHPCAAGTVCSGGSCAVTCATGLTNCSGACRDLSVDNANCGMCAHPCGAGTTCASGSCTVTCGTGLTNCSGTCRDLSIDRNNCGTCGMTCASTLVCSGGSCVAFCGTGTTSCSGTCRDLQNDRNNCGTCTHACASNEACTAGVCSVLCGPGVTVCPGGLCRDLQTDHNNCGACGHVCGSTETCSAGTCTAWVCTPGSASCVDMTTARTCNSNGLGYTTTTCGSMQSCSGGACASWVCTPGSTSCADSTTLRTCNADGLGSATSPCPLPAHATSATCSSGTCSFTCDMGYIRNGAQCVLASLAGDFCPGVDVVPDGPSVTLSTTGYNTNPDVGTVCGSAGASGWTDWVFHFQLSTARDVTITMTGGTTSTHMQLLAGTCGASGQAVGPCQSGSSVLRTYRALAAGNYYIIGENMGSTGPITVSVATSSPSTRASADACPGVDVTPDGATVTLTPGTFDNSSDYGTSCGSQRPTDGWRDWVYHFRLATARDIVVTMTSGSSTTRMQLESSCGVGSTQVGGCGTGSNIIRNYRGLSAGDYYIVAEDSTSPGTVQLAITTTAPGVRSAGDVCPGVNVAPDGGAVSINPSLFDNTSDYGTSCNSGGPGIDGYTDWVWHFTLATPRDVTVLMSPSPSNTSMQLQTACGTGVRPLGGCMHSAGAPLTRTYRALPAGDYYVVAESLGRPTPAMSFSLAVTTAAPSTRVSGDTCSTAASVTPDGATLLLDLSTMEHNADQGTACGSDVGFLSPWTDWVFSYTLATPRDVTISMGLSPSAAVSGMIESTCGDMNTSTSGCRTTASGTTWTRRIASQPAGTYYVVGESTATSGTLAATVTTASPGSFNSYTQSSPPASVTFVDACAAAGHSTVLMNVDDSSLTVTLPFAFRYWGTTLASGPIVGVSSNGFLTLNGTSLATTAGLIPDPTAPNSVVALYWRDLRTRASGVCVATVGTAPNRQFVVEWSDAYHYSGSGTEHLTFEAILNETSNTIDFLYNTMTGSGAATVGLENQDGSDGSTLCASNLSGCSITTGSRVRFTPVP